MANGLGLVIPTFQVMIPVEVLRGLWYALTTIPLLAIMKLPRWRTGLEIGLILAVFGAIIPQITNSSWPLPFKSTSHMRDIDGSDIASASREIMENVLDVGEVGK